jgi:hypothetical protein
MNATRIVERVKAEQVEEGLQREGKEVRTRRRTGYVRKRDRAEEQLAVAENVVYLSDPE